MINAISVIKTLFHTVGMTQNANYTLANIFGVSQCVGLSNYIFIRDTAYDIE